MEKPSGKQYTPIMIKLNTSDKRSILAIAVSNLHKLSKVPDDVKSQISLIKAVSVDPKYSKDLPEIITGLLYITCSYKTDRTPTRKEDLKLVDSWTKSAKDAKAKFIRRSSEIENPINEKELNIVPTKEQQKLYFGQYSPLSLEDFSSESFERIDKREGATCSKKCHMGQKPTPESLGDAFLQQAEGKTQEDVEEISSSESFEDNPFAKALHLLALKKEEDELAQKMGQQEQDPSLEALMQKVTSVSPLKPLDSNIPEKTPTQQFEILQRPKSPEKTVKIIGSKRSTPVSQTESEDESQEDITVREPYSPEHKSGASSPLLITASAESTSILDKIPLADTGSNIPGENKDLTSKIFQSVGEEIPTSSKQKEGKQQTPPLEQVIPPTRYDHRTFHVPEFIGIPEEYLSTFKIGEPFHIALEDKHRGHLLLKALVHGYDKETRSRLNYMILHPSLLMEFSKSTLVEDFAEKNLTSQLAEQMRYVIGYEFGRRDIPARLTSEEEVKKLIQSVEKLTTTVADLSLKQTLLEKKITTSGAGSSQIQLQSQRLDKLDAGITDIKNMLDPSMTPQLTGRLPTALASTTQSAQGISASASSSVPPSSVNLDSSTSELTTLTRFLFEFE